MRVLKVAIYLEHLKKCCHVQKCEKYYVSVVFFGVLILWCMCVWQHQLDKHDLASNSSKIEKDPKNTTIGQLPSNIFMSALSPLTRSSLPLL